MTRCLPSLGMVLVSLQMLTPVRAQAPPFVKGDAYPPIVVVRVNPADKSMSASNVMVGDMSKVAVKKAQKLVVNPAILNLPPEQRLEAMRKAHLQGTVLLEGHQKPVISMAWSQDGKRLVTGSRDGTARIWNPATGKELFSLEHGSPVALVAFSSNGKHVLTAPGVPALRDVHEAIRKQTPLNTSGKIILWDAANGQKEKVFDAQQKEIMSAALSPKGDLVAAAGRDKSLCVWSIAKGELLHKWELESPLVQIRFTLDGNLLGAGFEEKILRAFDPAARKELPPFKGMQEPVFGFTISGDGKFVLATCDPKFSTPLDEKNAFERTVVGVATLGISEIANAFQAKNETLTVMWNAATRELRFQGPGKNFDARQMAQFGFDFYELFNAMR